MATPIEISLAKKMSQISCGRFHKPLGDDRITCMVCAREDPCHRQTRKTVAEVVRYFYLRATGFALVTLARSDSTSDTPEGAKPLECIGHVRSPSLSEF